MVVQIRELRPFRDSLWCFDGRWKKFINNKITMNTHTDTTTNTTKRNNDEKFKNKNEKN